MLNAFFDGHSQYMDFKVDLVDREDAITHGLEDFAATAELYYLKHDPAKSHYLIQAYDETKDETYVMAFHQNCGVGRVFYFALGHDLAVLHNESFQKIVRRGVRWTAHKRKVDIQHAQIWRKSHRTAFCCIFAYSEFQRAGMV